MGVSVLNEEVFNEDVTFSPELHVEDSDNPHILGRIVGPFMDIEKDNGNGRWYERKTIEEGIVKNPYVVRMMKNKSLLGETHHPVDRDNIWSDESCISTVSLKISDDGKQLLGVADILDTPKGRIMNTLARYGTKLGISARANGKGVKQNGHLVIKKENYIFRTFDVVLNPGFDDARPNITEKDGITPIRPVMNEEKSDQDLYREIEESINNKTCSEEMLDTYISYSGNKSLESLRGLFLDEESQEGKLVPYILTVKKDGKESKVIVISQSGNKDKVGSDVTTADKDTEVVSVEETTEEGLANMINDLESKVSDLEVEKENHKDHNEHHDEHHDEHPDDRDEHHEDNKENEGENESPQVKDGDHENEELEDLRACNERLTEELVAVKSKVSDLNTQILYNKSEVKKMEEEHADELEKSINEALKGSDSVISEVLNKCDEYKGKCERLQEELDRTKAGMKKMEEEKQKVVGVEEKRVEIPKIVEKFKTGTKALNEEIEFPKEHKPDMRCIDLIKNVGGK